MIHWSWCRFPLEIAANVSMWHRKDILLTLDFPINMLVLGIPLLMSMVVGIVWDDYVYNLWGVKTCVDIFNIDCLCNHYWRVLQRFCRSSTSYRYLMCMCLVVILNS